MRPTARSVAAKAAIGSTVATTAGRVRAVSSRKTAADCPSPMSSSKSDTERPTQVTPTRTSDASPQTASRRADT
jgi:hypothetical protein